MKISSKNAYFKQLKNGRLKITARLLKAKHASGKNSSILGWCTANLWRRPQDSPYSTH